MSKRIYGCFRMIVMMSALGLRSQTNPILNPGFEAWSGGTPVNWSYSGKSYISQENNERFSGNSSAAVQVPVSSTVVELFQDIAITGGGTYSFSCRVLDNVAGGELALLINWRTADASLGTKTSSHSSDREGWQVLSLVNEQAPADATFARIRIRAYKQAGTGGGMCYADETAISGDFSLSVHMKRLEAIRGAEGIDIRWSTESEINTAGFWIWRAESEEGPFERVNTVMIPGSGTDSSGKSYSFTDRNAEAGRNYLYRLEELESDGDVSDLGTVRLAPQEGRQAVPSGMTLWTYPNPFNPQANVSFTILEEWSGGLIRIEILDFLGRGIRLLSDCTRRSGSYTVLWDGKDAHGQEVASGVYFCRLSSTDGFTISRRMLKIR